MEDLELAKRLKANEADLANLVAPENFGAVMGLVRERIGLSAEMARRERNLAKRDLNRVVRLFNELVWTVAKKGYLVNGEIGEIGAEVREIRESWA